VTKKLQKLLISTYGIRGPVSVVGIATGYRLDGPGLESRSSAPVQTGPGAHPASCTMGTGSFRGKERPRRDADPSPLLVPPSRKSRAIPLLPLWAVRPVQGCTFKYGMHQQGSISDHPPPPPPQKKKKRIAGKKRGRKIPIVRVRGG